MDQFMVRLKKQASNLNFCLTLDGNLIDNLIEKLWDFRAEKS